MFRVIYRQNWENDADVSFLSNFSGVASNLEIASIKYYPASLVCPPVTDHCAQLSDFFITFELRDLLQKNRPHHFSDLLPGNKALTLDQCSLMIMVLDTEITCSVVTNNFNSVFLLFLPILIFNLQVEDFKPCFSSCYKLACCS